MEKSETIHVRISPKIKKEAEEVLNKLGLSTSYAVSMFLQQVIYKKAIPFEISCLNDEDAKKKEKLAKIINQTGGKEISKNLEPIVHLYANGTIDYETACLIITRRFTNV